MANIFDLDPEKLARQQRYSNWLTAIAQGWHYAKEMNVSWDDLPNKSKELAKAYFAQMQEGEYILDDTPKMAIPVTVKQ